MGDGLNTMQVKCPHCRYKYKEPLKPAITELVSICPRCGQSFTVKVTEEDIRLDQAPPPTPQDYHQSTEDNEPPAVPTEAPAVPQTAAPAVPASAPEIPVAAQPHTVTNRQDYNAQHGSYPQNINHYNQLPPRRGGSGLSMPGIVLFILAAAITAGAIFGLSKLFGKDETEPVDTISTLINANEMSNSEMGNFSYNFEGQIMSSKKVLPIKMKITKTGTEIEGSYYYVNQNPRMTLELKGEVADDGTITMSEYFEDNVNYDSFVGKITADGMFKGTFKYQKNEYKFELKKVKQTIE